MSFDHPEPTKFTWPTRDNPESFYKFSSFWIEQGQKQVSIERSTYGLLEWLGDVGGLFDGLLIIGSSLVGPFAALSMQT